jgi:hypothetical protein
VRRSFARADRLIDRAEAANTATRTRRRLESAARLLGHTATAIQQLGERGRVSQVCAGVIVTTLRDGQSRAAELARTQ